jgi:hypothetical protein
MDLIPTSYTVLEAVPGHVLTMGCDAGKEKNTMWRVKNDIGEEHWLMYCERDTLCILCDNALRKIRQFEKEHFDGQPLTFFRQPNGYIGSTCKLTIHQIITDCYGNGKGTGVISIDHIDRNPLNNCVANLRVATLEEQQANAKGCLPGTKRQRMSHAQDLPDGLTQDMMPKHVVYYREVYNKEKNLTREFFKIENHPKLTKPWMTSKSNAVSIHDKLAAAVKVIADLEHDIQPQLQSELRGLPKYVSIQKFRDMDNLLYDRRDPNGDRLNLRMCMKDGYDLEQELTKFEAKLKKKYPELETWTN